MSNLPVLIKRCLTYGIVIYPFQLDTILRMYDKYQIPDDELNNLSPSCVKDYVKALNLSGQEMARDWTQGHKLLEQLGFEKKERKEGHRCFVTMKYTKELEK